MNDVIREKPFTELPTGSISLDVILDAHDTLSIIEALDVFAKLDRPIPHPTHDDASFTGMVLAEICRDWIESHE